uniref:Uncharacterized protein n=1 Tax=Anopheles arabiensis TaxID=7173 RepID=A0A182HHD3_ANOAR
MELAGVQPVCHPVRHVVIAAALRFLILVVRKAQIEPTGMEVERAPEQMASERGTLNVPARASLGKPLSGPKWFARFRSFPERKLAVPFVLGRFEVNRPVGGAVGETFLNERLHEADYRGNVVGDAQLYIRRTNVQPLQVAPKLVLVPACELLPVDLLLQCTGDYFVVNVRDVHRGDEREVEVMP